MSKILVLRILILLALSVINIEVFAAGQKYSLNVSETIYVYLSKDFNNHIKVENDSIISIAGTDGEYEYGIEQGELIIKPLTVSKGYFEVIIFLESGKSQHIRCKVQGVSEGQVVSLIEGKEGTLTEESLREEALEFINEITTTPINAKSLKEGGLDVTRIMRAKGVVNLGNSVYVTKALEFHGKNMTAYYIELKNKKFTEVNLDEKLIQIPGVNIIAMSLGDKILKGLQKTTLIIVCK